MKNISELRADLENSNAAFLAAFDECDDFYVGLALRQKAKAERDEADAALKSALGFQYMEKENLYRNPDNNQVW